MWIEGLSTRDKQSFLVRRALVLVLCHKKLLLSLLVYLKYFWHLVIYALVLAASVRRQVSHPWSAGGGTPE